MPKGKKKAAAAAAAAPAAAQFYTQSNAERARLRQDIRAQQDECLDAA